MGGGAGEGYSERDTTMQNSEKKLIKTLLEALANAGVQDAPGWIKGKRRELIHARTASEVVEDFAVLPRAPI